MQLVFLCNKKWFYICANILANKNLVHVILKIDRNGQRKMRKLTAALDKELKSISCRVTALVNLTICVGPDKILNTYHGELRQHKLRLEEMMEMTDSKEG